MMTSYIMSILKNVYIFIKMNLLLRRTVLLYYSIYARHCGTGSHNAFWQGENILFSSLCMGFPLESMKSFMTIRVGLAFLLADILLRYIYEKVSLLSYIYEKVTFISLYLREKLRFVTLFML